MTQNQLGMAQEGIFRQIVSDHHGVDGAAQFGHSLEIRAMVTDQDEWGAVVLILDLEYPAHFLAQWIGREGSKEDKIRLPQGQSVDRLEHVGSAHDSVAQRRQGRPKVW